MSARRPHIEPAPPAPPPAAAEGTLDFEEVYARYAGYVARVVIRLVGADEDVDDIVQEVFLLASRGLPKVKDPQAIGGWLATIAVRRCHRKLRRRKLGVFFGKRVPLEPNDIIASGASADERMAVLRVYAALDRVATGERLAWVLHHVEGEPLERVAALCRCSLSTAKRRIAAAQAAVEEGLGHA